MGRAEPEQALASNFDFPGKTTFMVIRAHGVLLFGLLSLTAAADSISAAEAVWVREGRDPVLSGDGRWVAYPCNSRSALCVTNTSTLATEILVTTLDSRDILQHVDIDWDGDTLAYWLRPGSNGSEELHVFHRDSATDEIISVTPEGEPGSQCCLQVPSIHSEPRLSGNGRFVAFSSYAEDLVSGDTNDKADIFVRDLLTATTVRVSIPNGGGEGDGHSGRWGEPPAISFDGSVVAFMSDAENLVSNDINDEHVRRDIFLANTFTGVIQRLSETPDGTGGEWNSRSVILNDDGDVAAFVTDSENLHAGPYPSDIFLRYEGGALSLINTPVSGDGSGSTFLDNYRSSISQNGAVIVFTEHSDQNLVSPAPSPPGLDTYVWNNGSISALIPYFGGEPLRINNADIDGSFSMVAAQAWVPIDGVSTLSIFLIDDPLPPEPPEVSLTPNPVIVDKPTVLSVTATDVGTGDSNIGLIEFQVDGGSWESIPTPVDGLYDEPTEEAETELIFASAGTRSICARAADGALNTGSPACVDLQVEAPPPTHRLRAIEVNQVIQNWRNEVPLYRGKDTVVRVFVEKADPAAADFANGKLHGSINGTPLTGSPIVTGCCASVSDDATVIDDPSTPRTNESWRAHLDNSVNYLLPRAWIEQTGPLALEFELTTPGEGVLVCAEPDGTPDCQVSVNFETGSRPIVQFFSVPYRRSEIIRLDVTATGGSYIFLNEGRESDAVNVDAAIGEIEEAIEDVLNADKSRVSVQATGIAGQFNITIFRGRNESLGIDASNVSSDGDAILTTQQEGGVLIAPTITGFGDIREQIRRIADLFPTDSVDFVIRKLGGFNRAPRVGTVNRRLETTRGIERAFGAAIGKYYGFMLQRQPDGGRNGMAWINVASTYANDSEEPDNQGSARNTGVHEAAHTYGRGHAVAEIRYVNGSPVEKIGICGSKMNLAVPLHPNIEEIPGLVNAGAVDPRRQFTWPTIGPLSEGPDAEIWGFSPRAFANGFDALTIIDPRRSPALMSYCNSPFAEQESWISDFSYQRLSTGLLAPRREPAGAGLPHEEILIISGTVDEERGEVEFDPPISVSGSGLGNEPGEVHVALIDGLGQEIIAGDVLLLGDGDFPNQGYGPGEVLKSFVAYLPVPGGSNPQGITVSMNAIELGRVTASLNPPTVEPPTIEIFDAPAGAFDVEWVAADLDGDLLTATLLLSTDLGLSWQVLAVGLETTTYRVPTGTLPASDAAMVRVLVSDGFHQAEATSLPFVLDAGYPLPAIEQPDPAMASVEPGDVLRLRGDAWDPEDGLLEGTALAWTIEDDRPAPLPFAFGAVVDVSASELDPGCQLIILTATDSDGRTGTDSVEVDIGATGCLGLGLIFFDGFE